MKASTLKPEQVESVCSRSKKNHLKKGLEGRAKSGLIQFAKVDADCGSSKHLETIRQGTLAYCSELEK